MMETITTENPIPKKREKQSNGIERVVIDSKNLDRVRTWMEQATSTRSGIELSIKKIVNWALEQLPEKLEGSHLKDLSDRFYDEVKFLEAALTQIKEAKTRGEPLTLQDILHANRASKTRAPHQPKGPKKQEAKSGPDGTPGPSSTTQTKPSVSGLKTGGRDGVMET